MKEFVMKKNNGLGRGLDHLFNRDENTITSDNANEVKFIAIEKIKPNIHQPRKQFDENALQELAASIKNQGIVQPLIVRKLDKENSYEIVAGERRYRAGKMLELSELPVIIREYSDIEAMTIALIENLQREDLNSMDEAEALNQLKIVHKLSQEELAEKIGKSRSNVANTLRLLALPEKIKALIANNSIKAGHGRALLGITDKEAQETLCRCIMERDLTVRDVENALEYWKRYASLPKEYLQAMPTQNKKTEKKGLCLSKNLQDIDTKLKDMFHKKAFIKGTEEKGSIKINYKNKDELLYILSVFSIDSKEL
jgi:ParB family chromosome partitioning protein